MTLRHREAQALWHLGVCMFCGGGGGVAGLRNRVGNRLSAARLHEWRDISLTAPCGLHLLMGLVSHSRLSEASW